MSIIVKGSFVEKLRVTESEHSLVLENTKPSWHVAREIIKSSWHVALEIIKSSWHVAPEIIKSSRHVELKVPGVFFFSLLMLCYCVLHVLRCFVHWNCCIQAMCSTVVCCKSFVRCNSVSADRSGMLASTLVERYLLCSTVLRF